MNRGTIVLRLLVAILAAVPVLLVNGAAPVLAAPVDPPLPPDDPALYTPLVPARLLDTRAGANTIDGLGVRGVPLGPGATLDLQVLGRGGVPAAGVSTVVLNITATEPTAPSFLTIWPTGEPNRPTASNLNFVAGETRPNLVFAKVGLAGNVRLFNAAGNVHVIADVAGYVPVTDDFEPIAPARLLDTRPTESTVDGLGRPGQPLGAGQSLNLQIVERGGVPPTGVSAVVLNVTATNPTARSFLTVWPTGRQRPTASNLNWAPGQTVPNLVVAKIGDAGSVSIYNEAGSVDVIADIAGYFPVGGTFVPIEPMRVYETRPGLHVAPGASAGNALGPDNAVEIPMRAIGDIPANGVSAVVLNVTAILPTEATFLTVWPTGLPRPLASNLNLAGGRSAVAPNIVVARLGSRGRVSVYNLAGTTDIAVDVLGYFVEEEAGIRTMAASAVSTCAADWLGRLSCWGLLPQEPNSPMTDFARHLVPTSIGTFGDIVDVALGYGHTCVLRGSGEVWCWAETTTVVFNGIAPTFGAPQPTWPAVKIDGLGTSVSIDSSDSEVCALQSDGRVRCWGMDHLGVVHRTPREIPGISDAVQLAMGGARHCVLIADGHVRCWGLGPLGDGNSTSSSTPVEVAGLTDADSIWVDAERSCATLSTGEAACWGWSYLGNGTTGSSTTPVPILDSATGEPLSDVWQVLGGSRFACVVRFDAQLYCWGSAFSMFSPGAVETSVPTRAVPNLPPIDWAYVGYGHLCTVSLAGDLYCWGGNEQGELGNGTTNPRTTPVSIGRR